jgi:hypothetical protein
MTGFLGIGSEQCKTAQSICRTEADRVYQVDSHVPEGATDKDKDEYQDNPTCMKVLFLHITNTHLHSSAQQKFHNNIMDDKIAGLTLLSKRTNSGEPMSDTQHTNGEGIAIANHQERAEKDESITAPALAVMAQQVSIEAGNFVPSTTPGATRSETPSAEAPT